MRVLKFDDLVNIARAIDDAGYGEDGITVTMAVPNFAILRRINEDFHYRFEIEGDIDEDINEINANIGGIGFKYYVDENLENS